MSDATQATQLTQATQAPAYDAYGPTPPTYTPTPLHDQKPAWLTADLALDYLAYSQGDPALAAERLGLASAQELLGILALDETVHARAQAVYRFMQLGRLLGTAGYVESHLLEKLENLDAKELARTYTALATAIETMTRAFTPLASAAQAAGAGAAPGTVNFNLTQNVLRLLPPDVRTAFRVLTAQPNGDMELDADTAMALDATEGERSAQALRGPNAA